MSNPYTYIIGWTELNKFYYGVRYANSVHPEEDLWKRYFTSSKHVKNFRELYGEPDLIKVDKIFDDKNEAYEYEQSKLKSLLLEDNWDNWLNKSLGFCIIWDDELKQRMKDYKNLPEIKELHRNKTKEQFSDPIKRERHRKACVSHKDKIWINNGIKNKRVTEESYLNQYSDWKRGRLIPKDCRFGNYDRSGENNPFFGKKHTEETKQKISQTKRNNNGN